MRSSSLQAHLNAAQGYAKLSKAKRLKVGAVLLKDDRIVSIGYNGDAPGGNNICEIEVGGELVTKPGVCHAELNCVAFAARNGISTLGTSLVTTHSPCFDCAKIIIMSGVQEVYYNEEYRDTTSLDYLEENFVSTFAIKEFE